MKGEAKLTEEVSKASRGRLVPKFSSDDEAEEFLNQDLSDLDFSQFKPVWPKFTRPDRSPETGSQDK
jgi:predicted DNA binding CopG/RHH family protein